MTRRKWKAGVDAGVLKSFIERTEANIFSLYWSKTNRDILSPRVRPYVLRGDPIYSKVLVGSSPNIVRKVRLL